MADQIIELNFKPNPVQKEFIESRGKADLFSSRLGEGKSVALVMACFVHTRQNPGARWLFIRDTFENLRNTTMQTFFEWFPEHEGWGSYHVTHHEWTWNPKICKGTILFRGATGPEDASKLASLELGGCAMDEPAPSSNSGGIHSEIFDMALGRLRQKGMNWYAMKLAENNPDQSHWTYNKFYEDAQPGFMLHQPRTAENLSNLPKNYYADLRANYEKSGRPDLVRRFVEGEAGFQMLGRSVTPNWDDRLHLAIGLGPVRPPRGGPLILGWDGGLNPTCIISQMQGDRWRILKAWVGNDMPLNELCQTQVIPELDTHYRGMEVINVGDPSMNARDETYGHQASRYIRKHIGGRWVDGVKQIEPRVSALNRALSHSVNGQGMVQVDRDNAKDVWYALRGGWHYKEQAGDTWSQQPRKNAHSHPGDAMSYLASYLWKADRALTEPNRRARGPDFGDASRHKPDPLLERGRKAMYQQPGQVQAPYW